MLGAPGQFSGPDGGIIDEVALHEERLVVTTEFVPVERVRLSTLIKTEMHTLSWQVRQEHIDVEIPGQALTTLAGTH